MERDESGRPPEAATADEAPSPPAGPVNPRATTRDQTVQVAELLSALEGAGEVLVLTHDNPDPDAIASAAALSFLLERAAGVDTKLAFGGIVGRAENRALIEELGVEFRRVETLEFPPGAVVALVDTQPRTGNNSLPEGRIATVVVDHHPRRPETGAVPFADVRPGYGATCSMLVEYLRAAKLEPPRRLATALFYGIQSETMDLGRDVSEADVSASLYLYPRSDPASISRIRHARVPAGYLASIHEALEKARRHGGVVSVLMGRLDYPDMVAEVADLFMRVEGVEWTLAAGRYRDDLLLSVRTHHPDAHAGDLMRRIVRERGSAGGHGMVAGAQLPVRGDSDEEVRELAVSLLEEVLEDVGEPLDGGEPVIGVGEGESGNDGGSR